MALRRDLRPHKANGRANHDHDQHDGKRYRKTLWKVEVLLERSRNGTKNRGNENRAEQEDDNCPQLPDKQHTGSDCDRREDTPDKRRSNFARVPVMLVDHDCEKRIALPSVPSKSAP